MIHELAANHNGRGRIIIAASLRNIKANHFPAPFLQVHARLAGPTPPSLYHHRLFERGRGRACGLILSRGACESLGAAGGVNMVWPDAN